MKLEDLAVDSITNNIIKELNLLSKTLRKQVVNSITTDFFTRLDIHFTEPIIKYHSDKMFEIISLLENDFISHRFENKDQILVLTLDIENGLDVKYGKSFLSESQLGYLKLSLNNYQLVIDTAYDFEVGKISFNSAIKILNSYCTPLKEQIKVRTQPTASRRPDRMVGGLNLLPDRLQNKIANSLINKILPDICLDKIHNFVAEKLKFIKEQLSKEFPILDDYDYRVIELPKTFIKIKVNFLMGILVSIQQKNQSSSYHRNFYLSLQHHPVVLQMLKCLLINQLTLNELLSNLEKIKDR